VLLQFPQKNGSGAITKRDHLKTINSEAKIEPTQPLFEKEPLANGLHIRMTRTRNSGSKKMNDNFTETLPLSTIDFITMASPVSKSSTNIDLML
jgi:hypothetical protein